MCIMCRISVDVELRVSRSRLKISSSTSQLTISCELLTFLFRHTVTNISWDRLANYFILFDNSSYKTNNFVSMVKLCRLSVFTNLSDLELSVFYRILSTPSKQTWG